MNMAWTLMFFLAKTITEIERHMYWTDLLIQKQRPPEEA
jgi:hypothetical protein